MDGMASGYKAAIEGLLKEMFDRGLVEDSKRNRLLVSIIKIALTYIVELLEDDDAGTG